MAAPADGPAEESRAARRARNALVLFFTLAALAVGVVFLLLTGRPDAPTADLRLSSWRVPEAEWAEQQTRDREIAATLTIGPDEEKAIAALHAYNAVEVETVGDSRSPRLRAAQSELRVVLQRYAGAHGVKRYHALGVHLRDRFVAALDVVLDGARRSGERPQLYVDRRPLAPDVEEWQLWAGAFLAQATKSGLILPDGAVSEGAEPIRGLFFLVRWFHWIHPVTDFTFQLSDTELFAFWGWKAERSEGLSLERRFELVEQIRRVRPSYPAAWVRGVLLARADRWQDAAREWQRWLAESPDDERAQENLAYAREVLASRHRIDAARKP